jgi:plastocyanin
MPRLASFVTALGVIAGMMGVVGGDERPPSTHTVTIEGMRFQPDVLTVAPGDTIMWVNRDLVPHTATSKDGDFDSKEIQAGESWSYTIRAAGDFAYICAFHPTMTATLRVK